MTHLCSLSYQLVGEERGVAVGTQVATQSCFGTEQQAQAPSSLSGCGCQSRGRSLSTSCQHQAGWDGGNRGRNSHSGTCPWETPSWERVTRLASPGTTRGIVPGTTLSMSAQLPGHCSRPSKGHLHFIERSLEPNFQGGPQTRMACSPWLPAVQPLCQEKRALPVLCFSKVWPRMGETNVLWRLLAEVARH